MGIIWKALQGEVIPPLGEQDGRAKEPSPIRILCPQTEFRYSPTNYYHSLLRSALPYGMIYHMAAKLLYQEKFVYADGAIREMVLWELPAKSATNPRGLKYRLFYGLPDGTCVVRYDNEAGKGDHKHIGEKEMPYPFRDVERLVADFLEDIERARRSKP